MRTDENVASGDSKLAALMRQGVTVARIVQLLQEAFPKRWQQHLRNRLGATRPTDLTPAELAEFTDHVFWLVKQTGMRDPAAMLVLRAQLDAKEATAKLVAPAEMADIAAERKSAEREPVALKNNSSKTYDSSPPRPVDLTMTTENPFDGREHDGRVFRDRHERNFFVGRLSPRQKEEWLRDHPDRWQTREEFLRDLQSPLSVLRNLAIVVDDPVARCARPAPAPSPPPQPGEADVSIGAGRPSSIVRPRSCQQQFR